MLAVRVVLSGFELLLDRPLPAAASQSFRFPRRGDTLPTTH